MQESVCPKCHGPKAFWNPMDGLMACPTCGVFSVPQFYLERVGLFLRDLSTAEPLPCGCWVKRQTQERLFFCATHLKDEQV